MAGGFGFPPFLPLRPACPQVKRWFCCCATTYVTSEAAAHGWSARRPPARPSARTLSVTLARGARGARHALRVVSSVFSVGRQVQTTEDTPSGKWASYLMLRGQRAVPMSPPQRRVGATRRRAQAELSVALFMRFPVVHFETPPPS